MMTNVYWIDTIALLRMNAATQKVHSDAIVRVTRQPNHRQRPPHAPHWKQRPHHDPTFIHTFTRRHRNDTQSQHHWVDTLDRPPKHRPLQVDTMNGTFDSGHAMLVSSAAVKVLVLTSTNVMWTIRVVGINDVWIQTDRSNASIYSHVPVDISQMKRGHSA